MPPGPQSWPTNMAHRADGTPLATLQNRYNKWRAKVRIPKALRERYEGREFMQATMNAMDRPTAKAEAAAWEAGLRLEWAAMESEGNATRDTLRQVYESGRRSALEGQFIVHADDDEQTPVELGINYEIDKLQELDEKKGLSDVDLAKLAGLQDALSEHQGKRVKRRRELEPSFSETAADYLKWWSAQHGLKESNTRQQKEATYRLFAGFFGDRPLLEIRKADAVGFMDALRRLDPFWGKSSRSKAMGWPELIREFGDHPKGLSASSLNRHAQTLSELWRWGEERDRCSGKNPFANLRQRLKPGKNQQGYRPWSSGELQALFDPPPSRQDVTEVMVVALHTGMRINEIASLTLGQIREEDGVAFIEVGDAKTEAGNRQVPIHPQIAWLSKLEGKPTDRVWPTFNPEGPGRKPGMDASTEFSRFKIAKGFRDRRKVFHSFRKNVTEIMERHRVPENEWAQVLGHERGFTYARYSPNGITIHQKAELIALIEYPGMEFPQYRT